MIVMQASWRQRHWWLSALNLSEPSTGEKALVNDALFYLLGNQDRYDIWYRGQATGRVPQALPPIAIDRMKATGNTQQFHFAGDCMALAGNHLHSRPVPYSTVTDLARFLGWSTSQPRRTAM
jgi:hypothetical protein